MTDKADDKDVNTGDVDDRVTDDHDAGLGSSVEDLEHHNPDIDDYDEALKDFDELLGDAEDTSGGTEITDDSDVSDGDDSGDGKDKDDDDKDKDDDPRVPKSRLDEVIAQRESFKDEMHKKELDWARKEAQFEARLAALEKPLDSKTTDPIDELLAGETQEVLDRFQEDPRTFITVVRDKAKADAIAAIRQEAEEKAYHDRMNSALDAFAKEHSDFMTNAERLVAKMQNDPIHNAISAYAYEIEIPALKAAHEEALKGVNDKIEAAKKESFILGKKQAIKEIQAKGAASVLDGSQGDQGGQANAGSDLDTDRDPVKLREKITADLLKKRAATG